MILNKFLTAQYPSKYIKYRNQGNIALKSFILIHFSQGNWEITKQASVLLLIDKTDLFLSAKTTYFHLSLSTVNIYVIV